MLVSLFGCKLVIVDEKKEHALCGFLVLCSLLYVQYTYIAIHYHSKVWVDTFF